MRLNTFFVLIFMVTSLDGKYRCDYTHFPKAEGWMKLHMMPSNWREARLRCYYEGGSLASPLNNGLKEAMRNLITQKLGTKRAVFTGIHSTFSKGDYFSVEGVHLVEIPHTWAANEPDNYKDNENCLAMLHDGNLADVNCDQPYPYICYKKAPSYVQLNTCGTLDPEYSLDLRTSSCYKFHILPRTWSRAYMTCAAEGGYLAIVNSETESLVLKEIFGKYMGKIQGNIEKDIAFVGYNDWGSHGDWITIDGRTLKEAGASKFTSGEPNNMTTGQSCGGIDAGTGTFNDLWCENRFAFICEKRPDSPLCLDDVV